MQYRLFTSNAKELQNEGQINNMKGRLRKLLTMPFHPQSTGGEILGTQNLLWRAYINVIIWKGWSTKGSTLGQS